VQRTIDAEPRRLAARAMSIDLKTGAVQARKLWEHFVVLGTPDTSKSEPASILKDHTPRPLPIALAHKMAVTRPGDPHLATLLNLFVSLSRAERFDFMFETIRVHGRRPEELHKLPLRP
jgi:hypothetical protein